MLVGKQTGKWPDDCDCHEKDSSSRILGVQMPLIRGPAASIKRWMRASDEVRDGWGRPVMVRCVRGRRDDRPRPWAGQARAEGQPLTSRGERTTGTVRDGVVAHAHERNGRSDDGVSSPRFMVGRSPRRSQRGSSETAVAALLVAGRAGAGSLQWGGSRAGQQRQPLWMRAASRLCTEAVAAGYGRRPAARPAAVGASGGRPGEAPRLTDGTLERHRVLRGGVGQGAPASGWGWDGTSGVP
ncbi:hypothetical protein ACCO45_004317 [Purpureocillium lilacinum]|uniref:Uncharacterized protein n=1 Tax=Purpureocillium lilacinum TaxID=33203 RepID=A0ACC4E2E1_PURLI